MVAQETVTKLSAFLRLARKRRHWYIIEGLAHWGTEYSRVSVILTGLDDRKNIVRFFHYFGSSDGDAKPEERREQYKKLLDKSKEWIAKLPQDLTEGLWEISR